MIEKKYDISTGFVNYHVSIHLCSTKDMREARYIDDDMEVMGMCRKIGLLDYLLVFNTDYEISAENVLHEVYHLFFEVLNDIGRNDEYYARELGKDLYCYMFVDMFKKTWGIVQEEFKSESTDGLDSNSL